MKRVSIYWTIIIFLFLTAEKGIAQVLVPDASTGPTQQVFLSMGLEPEWTCTIGYMHKVGKGNNCIDFYLGGSLKVAPIILSDGAWRANFLSTANLKINEAWRMPVTSSIYLAHDRNRAGEMHGLGIELRVVPSYVRNNWVKGIDVGWQYTALTHIKHSNQTKDTFNDRYPGTEKGIQGPKDGWYGSTAQCFRLGVMAGRRINKHLAFQFNIGSLFSIQRQGILLNFAHAQVPVYLETHVAWNFD